MDHGDNEILDLIKIGPGYRMSGKEFVGVVRSLFENPYVTQTNIPRISEPSFPKLATSISPSVTMASIFPS